MTSIQTTSSAQQHNHPPLTHTHKKQKTKNKQTISSPIDHTYTILKTDSQVVGVDDSRESGCYESTAHHGASPPYAATWPTKYHTLCTPHT